MCKIKRRVNYVIANQISGIASIARVFVAIGGETVLMPSSYDSGVEDRSHGK